MRFSVGTVETAIAPLRERRKDRQRRRQSSLSVMNAGDQACPETRPCPRPSSGSRKPARTLAGKADGRDVLLANVESQHRHAAQLNTHAHPFVEWLIGTVRREYLDHILFWTTADLENKLLDFSTYFNNHRTYDSLEGRTPDTSVTRPIVNIRSIRWQPHCRALYQTPVAA
jgi:hypothetical protein